MLDLNVFVARSWEKRGLVITGAVMIAVSVAAGVIGSTMNMLPSILLGGAALLTAGLMAGYWYASRKSQTTCVVSPHLSAVRHPQLMAGQNIIDEHQRELVTRLRTVLGITNELIACPDLDTTLRQAVESAREKLGAERCAIFLKDNGELVGTYGTDRHGQTTLEGALRIPVQETWQKSFQGLSLQDARWVIVEDMMFDWNEERPVPLGKGWIGVTPIQVAGELGGIFFNDTAISGAPINKNTQEAISVFCSLLGGIIESKRSEENIRRALQKEQELGQLKSRFITTISHEFRTPLATILSSAELLKHYSDRMSEERKQEHVAQIATQVDRMTGLLEDVLTVGKAEAVGVDFHPVPVDLPSFCAALVAELRLTFGTRQLMYSSQGQDGQAVVDERLLRQIVTNLLTNAIKYSPPESMVHFAVICETERALIRVQDHGIGIPEQDQARLFDVFHRAGNVGTIPGTGLGLAIVKRAVDAHGGTLTLDTQVGVGTTFTVVLPTKPLA